MLTLSSASLNPPSINNSVKLPFNSLLLVSSRSAFSSACVKFLAAASELIRFSSTMSFASSAILRFTSKASFSSCAICAFNIALLPITSPFLLDSPAALLFAEAINFAFISSDTSTPAKSSSNPFNMLNPLG